MTGGPFTRAYGPLPLREKEVLRYAGVREENEETWHLLQECIRETEGKLSPRVIFCTLLVQNDESGCRLGPIYFPSKDLARHLARCPRAVLFGATLGVGIDRLIEKYSRLSPAKALMLQAIGTQQIEALCDAFCREIEKESGAPLRPRFSPGYGDLPLETQGEIFAFLAPEKRIGLTLTDHFLMSPSKSVTAIVGLGEKE